VILSGMGSDGTLGLRAIKGKAGLTLVQEPASAKFDAMPRSAIDAGVVDIVAPLEELPAKIVAYLRQVRPDIEHEPILESKSQIALEKIVILLRERTGNDFFVLQEKHRVPPHRAPHESAPDRCDYQLRALSARKSAGS
ncbi:MAG: chemotaxis protein CheB, partial [Oxalobacteraceae bacterium]